MHTTKANRMIVLQSCKSSITLQKTEKARKEMNSWDSSVRITAAVYSYSDQENQWQIIKLTPSILSIYCKFRFEIAYLLFATYPPLREKNPNKIPPSFHQIWVCCLNLFFYSKIRKRKEPHRIKMSPILSS